MYSYGDRWDNYDSNSQSLHNNNVDWAVDLVFYDNAEVDKVKNLINQYNGVGHSGGTKHIIVREANEYQNGSSISYVQMWDDDSGKKNVAPNCSTYCPYRSAAAQTMPAQIGTSAERSGRRSPLDIAITVGGRPSNWS